jgi:hypothetical protein
MEVNWPKRIYPKMRRHKLRSVIKWQRALNQKMLKQMDVKQDLGAQVKLKFTLEEAQKGSRGIALLFF